MFGTSGSAENAASAYSTPNAVFYAWLWESSSSTSCAWSQSNGHRANILGPYAEMGAAYADASDGTRYWIVDFATPTAARWVPPFNAR